MRVTFTDGCKINVAADTPAERAALSQFVADVGREPRSCQVTDAPVDGTICLEVLKPAPKVEAPVVEKAAPHAPKEPAHTRAVKSAASRRHPSKAVAKPKAKSRR